MKHYDIDIDDQKLVDMATQKFEDEYPQQFCLVYRPAPPEVKGACAAGTGWTTKEVAVGYARQVLSGTSPEERFAQLRDAESARLLEGFEPLSHEGVKSEEGFMLLIRKTLVSKFGTKGQVITVNDNVIESVYLYKNTTWRHVWGFRLEL